MYILGLSFDYHDSAAALVKDGRVIFAIQEERFEMSMNTDSQKDVSLFLSSLK